VAVAAAVARLLAPGDAAAARRALDLAGAAVLLTDAGTVFGGSTGSHAFLGASVQLGSSLGLAAVAGLATPAGALERHLARVAARAWTATELHPGNGAGWQPYEVLGGYVKVHPTCAHLHGVGDAVADLVDRGVRGADVRSVEVRTTAATAAFAAVADDELAARFSVPTSVAVALLTGRLDETTLDGPTVASAAVRSLAGRVQVVHDPALDAGYPAGRPARVTVTLADGRELRAECGRPRGDADRALTRGELAGKAERLLTARFGPAAAALLPAVHALGSGGTARELGAALRAAAQDQEDTP